MAKREMENVPLNHVVFPWNGGYLEGPHIEGKQRHDFGIIFSFLVLVYRE
jgi:hypothetical protein